MWHLETVLRPRGEPPGGLSGQAAERGAGRGAEGHLPRPRRTAPHRAPPGRLPPPLRATARLRVTYVRPQLRRVHAYTHAYIHICIYIYVRWHTRSGGWWLGLPDLPLRQTRTRIRSVYAYARMSIHIPVKEVQEKFLAEAPRRRGPAGFPLDNGGGWGGWSFLPPPPVPELRCGDGRPWAAETPPAASGRPAPGAAFPAPASASAPPGRRDPAARRGRPREAAPALTVAELEQRGGVVEAAVAGEAVLHPAAALPASPRLSRRPPAASSPTQLRSGGGWGRGGLLPASLSCHGNPFTPPRLGLGRRPLRSAPPLRRGGETRGAGRGGVTARRRGGRRRRGCSPQRTRGCSRARRRLASAAPRRAAQPPPGGWQAEGRSRRRGGGAAPSERGRRDLAGREPLGGRGRREGRASAAAGPGAPLARAGRGGGGGGTGTGTHGGAAGPAGSRVLRLGAGPARPFALGGPAEPPRRRNPAPVWKRGERRSPVRRRGAVPPARRRDAARRGALIGARWSGGTARPCGGKCPPSGCGGEPAARPRSDRLRVEGRSFAASAGAGCRLESAGQPTASASVPPYRSDALLIAGLADAPRFFHWSNRLRVVAPYALHGFQWRFSWLQDRVVRIILTLPYNGGGRCVV